MALCDKFNNLSHFEKITIIGEIVHAIQSDDEMFTMGEQLLKKAKRKGVLDGITILPETNLLTNTNEEDATTK